MRLEKLLNGLIELGWKPRGREDDKDIIVLTGKYTFIRIGNNYNNGVLVRSLNDLCSIDSGLRQFVCEKGLYVEQEFEDYQINMGLAPFTDHTKQNYRLMLSAIQEDKEKFILDNIILPTKKDK